MMLTRFWYTQIVENAAAKLQAVAAVLSLLGMLLRLDGLVSPARVSAVCCLLSAVAAPGWKCRPFTPAALSLK
jgi:hypothetical protein